MGKDGSILSSLVLFLAVASIGIDYVLLIQTFFLSEDSGNFLPVIQFPDR